MTDRFNPDTHKFGMAYALEGGFIFYPFPLEYGNSDWIDGLVIHIETSCRHPSDECVDKLTRAPEHDLVPRQAVTGDECTVVDAPIRKINNTEENN